MSVDDISTQCDRVRLSQLSVVLVANCQHTLIFTVEGDLWHQQGTHPPELEVVPI
ncbi:MAG: hypothetical protein KME06_09245 [Kastovskya adunca ATA6-11-RM4]|nr:hypothetical protein [Kastovskya adunca ATA6-11-RM4]